MLFAGVSSAGTPGAIRAYPLDQRVATNNSRAGDGRESEGNVLNMEFQEYVCLSLPVTCMTLNHDGSLLFIAGEDGVLAMFCVAENLKDAEKKVQRVSRCRRREIGGVRRWQSRGYNSGREERVLLSSYLAFAITMSRVIASRRFGGRYSYPDNRCSCCCCCKVRERGAMEYMEEILVTRADMNARSKQVQELKNAVDELTLNNEYQLRLKDMNYKEKVS